MKPEILFKEAYLKMITEAEEQALANNPLTKIDLAPVYKETAKRLGVSEDKLTFKKSDIKKGRAGEYNEITSNELVEESGIFKSVFESVIVQGTASFAEAVAPSYFCELNIRWTHTNGGSNGTTLLRASQVGGKEWHFSK